MMLKSKMETYSMYLVLSLLVLGGVSVAEGGSCKFPPSLWCSSPEIARACQVEQQCRDYLRVDVDAELVDLTLYYETLCPDCQNFYKKQLYPTYQKVGSIMNITLVPYGNAHEKKSVSGKWEFQCQHGEQECVGNLIDTCTINIVKNFTVYFPFINCMENELARSRVKPPMAAEKCAKTFNIQSIDNILSCSTSDTGLELEHQMAVQTDALNPPHKYVPWVTLNGVHTETIQNEAEKDLTSLICKTYKGPKPAGCQDNTLRYNHRL